MRLSFKNKKNLIITSIIAASVIVLLGGYTALSYSQSWWPFQKTAVTQDETSNPTQEDQENEEPIYNGEKGNPPVPADEDTDNGQTGSDGKQVVQVAIAFADPIDGAVEIRSFISGVVEGDGTCTATLTQNGQTVTASSEAFIDVTTSQCEPIRIPLSQFPTTGTWKLVMTYVSPSSQGTSDSMDVAV